MGTLFGLVDVEQRISLDVVDEAGAGPHERFEDEFEQVAYVAVEVVFDFGLSAGWGKEYRPGRCFWMRNHLLPY